MHLEKLISKQELITQLTQQIEDTGTWWDDSDVDENGNVDFSNLEYEYKHLVISSNQMDLIKMYDISIDDFCNENEIDFVSKTCEGTIEFIHTTRKSNLENIKQIGLIVDYEACFIPDLGEGIYGVPIDSEKGIDNLKTFLVDFDENEIPLIKGSYNGKYNYCFKGDLHQGYIVFHNKKIGPENLYFEVISVDDFLLNY